MWDQHFRAVFQPLMTFKPSAVLKIFVVCLKYHQAFVADTLRAWAESLVEENNQRGLDRDFSFML